MRNEPRWRRYVRFWRSNVRADLDDEFAFHVQERIDDLVARGMEPRQARDEALKGFGDIDRVKNTCRVLAEEQETQMKRSEQLGVVKQDMTYALRLMRAHPTFTAAITLTLALGIGATTAIFSLVYAVLLRPLPYADADRMVLISERFQQGRGNASVGHFHDWTELSGGRVFEATAAYQRRSFNLSDGEPTRIFGASVTPGFFKTGYMRPELGRYFLPDETSASRVVVLSYPLWQSQFSSDSSIIGRQITLNGEKHTVIGVTPAAYTLTQFDEKLWTPLSFTPEQRGNYGAHFLVVFGKLKPGVTLAQAQREMERITEDIRRRQPENMRERGVEVQSFEDVIVSGYRTQLWVLLGAVTFVLLIGCGNVASLLLARATARRKEIAIRGALGGGRRRLVRQLLTESFLLAFIGGAASLIVGYFGVRFLVSNAPPGVPRLSEAGLQPGVLSFAILTTLVCGLFFGLAPALRATRVNLQGELREGGRGGGSGGIAHDRARGMLIVTEIAGALVLLVSAGLFIRSAQRLQGVSAGFEAAGVTMMRMALPPERYAEPPAIVGAYERIVNEIRAIPGVQAAAASTRVPMWGPSIDMGVRVDGRPQENKVDLGHVRLMTTGYFEALRIPLLRGRVLQESDLVSGAPWVVVVNETFAKRVFGSENPIGQRISGWARDTVPQWREIVGVARDVRAFGRESDIPPEIYIPLTQAPDGAWNSFQRAMTVVALARAGITIAPAMRAAVKRVDPTIPLYDVQAMNDVLARDTATRRFNTLLLAALGLTGLILAAIGIYGVIAYFVSQRTHEIGVRVALGATTQRVVGMVVQQAVTLALIGIIVGAIVAFWATRVLTTMLFEVSSRDPVAYIAAAAALLIVALAAAWLPARRAARVDPIKALGAA